MKLRVLGMAAVLVLAPAWLQAQIVRRGPTKGAQVAAETVHLYLKANTLDRMIPVLQAEGTAGDNSLDAKLAARGMNKQEYVANKNALMIARQDALNPGRLAAIKDDLGAFQARDANAKLYQANKSRLDAVLSKLEPEPGCALCSGPTVPVKNR